MNEYSTIKEALEKVGINFREGNATRINGYTKYLEIEVDNAYVNFDFDEDNEYIGVSLWY